jgi:hypothetical protein
MKSFIAFHEDKGIYIGVFAGFALFSTNNLAYTYKAIRFESETELKDFFEKSVPAVSQAIQAISIETDSTDYYVDVVDILKSGHTKHTESLLEHFPCSETIH